MQMHCPEDQRNRAVRSRETLWILCRAVSVTTAKEFRGVRRLSKTRLMTSYLCHLEYCECQGPLRYPLAIKQTDVVLKTFVEWLRGEEPDEGSLGLASPELKHMTVDEP